MTKKAQTKKKIPNKNYLIALLSILAALLLTLYGFEWYKFYQSERMSESYLISSNTILKEIKNLEDLPIVLSEPPSEYFLYISYTNSREIHRLEKDLAKIIKEYDLKEEFYFLNVTDIKDDKDFFTKLNKTLDLSFEIKNVPIILYFRDSEFVNRIPYPDTNKIIKAADFQHLIDKFEITRD